MNVNWSVLYKFLLYSYRKYRMDDTGPFNVGPYVNISVTYTILLIRLSLTKSTIGACLVVIVIE